MEQRPANVMPVVIAALLLCPVLYVGSYFAIVKRYELAWTTDGYWVECRIGGRAAETFFAPLHHLDRRIRRSYWEPQRAVLIEFSEFAEEITSPAPVDSNWEKVTYQPGDDDKQTSAAAKMQEAQTLTGEITEDIESSDKPDPGLHEERDDTRMKQED